MKLVTEEYFDEFGQVNITEKGWIDLRSYCEAIIVKRTGGHKEYIQDLVSGALIRCMEKLPDYDPKKNDQLGGFLYWCVRCEISRTALRVYREVPIGQIEDVRDCQTGRRTLECSAKMDGIDEHDY